MELRTGFTLYKKALLVGATLIGSCVLLGAPRSRAADDENCQKRVARIDHQLHKAAERHGWDSREVTEQRTRLQEARQWCWEHEHRWWDEDQRRWHTDRDWDEHDHDHPHDHDRPDHPQH